MTKTTSAQRREARFGKIEPKPYENFGKIKPKTTSRFSEILNHANECFAEERAASEKIMKSIVVEVLAIVAADLIFHWLIGSEDDEQTDYPFAGKSFEELAILEATGNF